MVVTGCPCVLGVVLRFVTTAIGGVTVPTLFSDIGVTGVQPYLYWMLIDD